MKPLLFALIVLVLTVAACIVTRAPEEKSSIETQARDSIKTYQYNNKENIELENE